MFDRIRQKHRRHVMIIYNAPRATYECSVYTSRQVSVINGLSAHGFVHLPRDEMTIVLLFPCDASLCY